MSEKSPTSSPYPDTGAYPAGITVLRCLLRRFLSDSAGTVPGSAPAELVRCRHGTGDKTMIFFDARQRCSRVRHLARYSM